MFNVGGGEMLAILLLALLVLGPERLPKAMAEVGKVVGQLRRMSSGFQDELKKAMDAANIPSDDGDTPFRPGEEVLPALPPGVEEEVRVVHGTTAELEAHDPDDRRDPEPAPLSDVDEGDPEPGATAGSGAVDASGDAEASVTPIRPRRDDETRATG